MATHANTTSPPIPANIVTISTEQTMSSREIAELVEKRHDNVKRTIETLAKAGLVHPQIEDEPETDAMGRTRVTKVYRVGKRDSYVIVAQLSPEFTARLVDRWQELESRAADPMVALNDPATMRHLLLGYSEKVIALESKVEEMQPTVQAFDRIAKADGSLCITDAAKNLQVRPKDLTDWLQAHGWIYKRVGKRVWLGYQVKIQQGLLEHKVHSFTRADGTEGFDEQVRITPKGLAKLAELLSGGRA